MLCSTMFSLVLGEYRKLVVLRPHSTRSMRQMMMTHRHHSLPVRVAAATEGRDGAYGEPLNGTTWCSVVKSAARRSEGLL